MDKIVEMAFEWVCTKTSQWLAAKCAPQCDESELELTMHYLDDDGGRRIRIRVPRGDGDGKCVSMVLTSSPGVFVKSISEFADNDGDFGLTGKFNGDEFVMYLPFSALIYPNAGEYALSMIVFRLEGTSPTDPLGHWKFNFQLPAPRRWDKMAHLAPLIALCMMVVRSGGRAVPEKVRQLKESLITSFDLTPAEVIALRDAMKRAPVGDVRSLAERTWFRHFGLGVDGFIELLATIAKSDGDLTNSELTIIRDTALAIGVAESEWHLLAEKVGLALDDPWKTLGVARDATFGEIKAAYRRKMNEYHPDRFGQNPPEFLDLATKLTVDLQRAYCRLKEMLVQPV